MLLTIECSNGIKLNSISVMIRLINLSFKLKLSYCSASLNYDHPSRLKIKSQYLVELLMIYPVILMQI